MGGRCKQGASLPIKVLMGRGRGICGEFGVKLFWVYGCPEIECLKFSGVFRVVQKGQDFWHTHTKLWSHLISLTSLHSILYLPFECSDHCSIGPSQVLPKKCLLAASYHDNLGWNSTSSGFTFWQEINPLRLNWRKAIFPLYFATVSGSIKIWLVH